MRKYVFLAVAISLFAPAGSAVAQSVAVGAGDRIRITRAGQVAATEFTVVDSRPDTLHVRGSTGSVVEQVALSGVQRVEVFRGRPRSATFGRRVLIGAGVGALAGGLLLALTDEDDFFGESEGAQFAVGAVGGAAVGGAIGALAGLAGSSGRWETVYVR